MFVRFTTPKLARALAGGVPVLVGLSLLCGCSRDGYPARLDYPVRSGLMITAAPTPPNPPTRFDPPGGLDEMLADEKSEVLSKQQGVDLSKLTPDDRAQYQETLDKVFGKPAAPTVLTDEKFVRDLKLEPERLELGSRLYRRHCLHCHGVPGDGRGPTAPWVNPHPRDYRRGIFKFTSSSQSYGDARKPRREDLLRTLREGIDGTSMPSFRLLAPDELEALVSYVMHLSIRGETEFATMLEQLGTGFEEGESIASRVPFYTKRIATYWWQASFARDGDKLKYLIEPGKYPSFTEEKREASIRNGYRLFVISGPTSASCVSCHKDFGRQSPLSYDVWGTIVRPLDLTAGVYRGGRRPIDFYYRIHSGINGAGMTAFGTTLSSDQIWDLVNFLQALPYPQMLPADIRARIYSEP